MKSINNFIIERLKLNKDSKPSDIRYIDFDMFIDRLSKLDTNFGKPIDVSNNNVHDDIYEEGKCYLFKNSKKTIMAYIIEELSDENTGDIYYNAILITFCNYKNKYKMIRPSFCLLLDLDMLIKNYIRIGKKNKNEWLDFYIKYEYIDNFMNDFKTFLNHVYKGGNIIDKIKQFNKYLEITDYKYFLFSDEIDN